MKLTKKLEAEILQIYHAYWDAYLTGDMKTFASMLDENIKVFGSAVSEVFHNKDETVRFYESTADQLTGKVQFRNRKISLHPVDHTILIHEQSDLFVLIDEEWTFYGPARISALFAKTPEGWKLAHQHGSFPDSRAEEGEQLAAEKIKKENLELREAVQRRTIELEQKNRELEIEAGLERVRGVAMGMKHSSDVLEICKIMFRELQALGFSDLRNTLINFWDDAHGVLHDYDYSDVTGANVAKLSYNSHPTFEQFQHKIKKAKDAFAELIVSADELESWKQRRRESGEYEDPRLEGITALYYYFYSIGVGSVGISTFSPLTVEKLDILKRFRNVFDLSYQRYADITLAEAQAREAQIEAALERVRSRSMGMQKSEELKEVIKIVYEQLIQLKINLDHAGFVVDYKPKGDWTFWIADERDIPSKITHPYFESVWANQFNEAKKKGKDFFATHLNFEEKNKFYNELLSYVPGLPEASKEFYLSCPGLAATTVLLDNVGLYIENFSGTPYTDEENATLMRFGKVFQQTYTRFLDLQKAEAQARESQIEAALERTRTRSMMMQHSEELLDISKVFHEQLLLLGIDSEFSFVWLPNEENGDHLFWTTWMEEKDGNKNFRARAISYPLDMTEPYTAACFVDWRSGVSVHEHFIAPEDIPTFFASWEELLAGADRLTPECFPDGIYYTEAFMKYGCFGIDIRRPLLQQEKDILHRFAIEFERTYTRFLDLQKAEAQAREAQIELSLEKIRAKVTAMNESSDLLDIVVTMRTEFVGLGHEAHYFWHMRWLPDKYEKAMTSGDGTRIGMIMELPRGFHEDQRMIDWEVSNDPVVIFTYDAEGAVDYVDKMITTGRFDLVDHNAPGPDDIRAIGGLTFIMARTTHGEIGYSLPGIVANPPAEDLATLVRFAGVFDLAYRRFEDLKIAEAQARQAQLDLIQLQQAKKKAEDALSELRATQEQLLQQEKLASLGQLTAGIAHEIKNPLNFVNNFSSVSVELVDEAMEEIKKLSDNGGEAQQLLSDVKKNLNKIIEHGTRADGIVKSMLQHSRGGSGKKEPTDLNALVKEYVNLAFHTMRATKNPINVDISLDLDATVGTVPLIAEDFSRVVLNLCQNAFDAMREKLNAGSKSYLPKLAARTRREANQVTFEIEDNGPGIPDAIKDKILQPFFTTKKGTQGTGLGLSITHDIVKAHGGTVTIESSEPIGSIFRIAIPLSGS